MRYPSAPSPRAEEEPLHLVVRGINLELSPADRAYTEAKLARLERRLGEDVEVEIELSQEPHAHHLAAGNVLVKGEPLRASESATSLRAAVDLLVENLERQLTRYREKRRLEPRRRGGQQRA